MSTVSDEHESSSMNPITRMISVVDFQRIEGKLDEMAKAITKLVLVEERQTNQSIAITELRGQVEANRTALEKISDSAKNSVDRVEKKVDQWINRGVGIWLFVLGLSTLTGIALAFKGFGHG